MYAITGITGQVGGVVARTLLSQGHPVRAVLRNPAKAEAWAKPGCEIAVAQMHDTGALARAFAGCEAVFILLPPVFDPDPELSRTRANVAAIRSALQAARPGKVVCISTIGAQAREFNLLTQLGLLEQALENLDPPVAFLRPAWFMENTAWDVEPARAGAVVPSFLQPLDKPFPMVSVTDVGRVAAELLRENWSGRRIVELEGPARVTPNEVAAALASLLGREVRMQPVPRETWEDLFRSQGMRNPAPRARMLDGFNEGWIEFEGGATGSRKGKTALHEALRGLIGQPA
jgi:uncharacterized protein YbjT (DUF2867 family)